MQFKADATMLKQSVKRLSAVRARRSTVPILGHIMVTVQDGALSLLATDMEIVISEKVPCIGIADGAGTIDPGVFYRILSALSPGAEVSVSRSADGNMKIASGSFDASTISLSPSDFPTMPTHSVTHEFSISADKLFGLFAKIRHAISTEETRYYLNGICLHDSVDALVAVATDGHRLMLGRLPLPSGAKGMGQIIIPRAVIGLVCQFAKLAQDVPVSISGKGVQIQFDIGTISIRAKPIDGTFPDYTRVMPTKTNHPIAMRRNDLEPIVRRVAAVSSTRPSPIRFDVSTDMITISSKDSYGASAKESLNGGRVSYGGAPVIIEFNSRYVKDILGAFGDAMEWSIKNGTEPVLITSPKPPRSRNWRRCWTCTAER